MTAIVSTNFRLYNALQFIVSIGSNNVYAFMGKSDPWKDIGFSDSNPPDPKDSVQEISRTVWDDMIAAKKITQSDVSFAIKRYDWQSGVAYPKYDPANKDLFRNQFYVYNSTEARVYKCLNNNSGGASTVMPSGVGTSGGVISTSDGYTWKYMYTLDAGQIEKFLTATYIPVPFATLPGNTYAPDGTIFPIAQDSGGNPINGHGGNNVRELYAFYIIVAVKFNGTENGVLSVQNDYRKIGLISQPAKKNNTLASDAIYDQTVKIYLTGSPTLFSIDEMVTVGDTNGYVLDRGSNFIRVSGNVKDFPTSGVVSGTLGGNTTISQLGVVTGDLRKYSGSVLHMEYRKPIPRSADQSENINIVLEF